MSPRGFGRHWANEHGHLHTPAKNESHPSSFPPDLLAENRAAIERKKAEKERQP